MAYVQDETPVSLTRRQRRSDWDQAFGLRRARCQMVGVCDRRVQANQIIVHRHLGVDTSRQHGCSCSLRPSTDQPLAALASVTVAAKVITTWPSPWSPSTVVSADANS